MPRSLPPSIITRRECVRLSVAAALSLSLRAKGEDTIMPEWGKRWQPVLPARERHPALFYDDTDRERMRQRLNRLPYSLWWKDIGEHSVRSSPAFVWWLTGDENAA